MAKLSIDIGVNLGEATRQLGKLNSALISLNSNAEKLVSTLKQIGKINIKPTVGMNTGGAAPQATPKQVPNVFEQYTQGASSATNITDLLEAKLEQLVARSNELKQTLAGGIGFMDPSSSLEELKQVENQIKQVQGLLKSQSFNIVAPKNIPDIFKDFRSGASGAATAIDFLRQREQELISQSNALRASLSTNVSAGGFQETARDIKQVEDELKKVQALIGLQPPDIFADFKSGAIQASTALEFLEIKQQELIQESLRLKNALAQASTGEEFTKLQNELNKTEKELNDVTRAIQAQKAPVGGAAGAYGNLTKTTNLANLSVVNFGRVLQDLPFGILGIANNLNPLIEGLRDLNVEAKKNGTTLKKELFNSLKGFGGLTLAISGVSAALSFASIGLSYWTRDLTKARDEQEKFNDGLAKAQSKAYETGKVLSDLVAEGSKYTKGSIEQTRVINKINGLLDENTQKINANSFANGEATRITKGFTEALIARGAAEFALAKSSEASAKLRILQNRQLELSQTEGVFAAAKALDAAKTFGLASTVGAPIFDWLQSTFGSDVGKKAQEYKDNVKEIADLTKEVGRFSDVYDQAQAEFKASSDSIAKDSRYKQLTDEIKGFEDQQKSLTGTYKEQRAEYDRLTNEIKIRREELDQILGKEKDAAKSRQAQKTIAEKLKELYKEINADLIKIESRRDLNPLEKATESAKVLESGLDNILDLDIKQLNVDQFKKLEERLKGFESIKVGLEVKKIKTDLNNALKQLDEKGRILKIDVSKDKVKEVDNALDELYNKYNDKNISPVDRQKVLIEIQDLQGKLSELNLNSLFQGGVKSFKEFNDRIKSLQAKSIFLKVSTNKEQLDETKKTIDDLLDLRIELFTKGDVSRGLILIPLLQKLQAEFTKLQTAVNKDKLTDIFKNYKLEIAKIGEDTKAQIPFADIFDTTEAELNIKKAKANLQSAFEALIKSLAVTKGAPNVFTLFYLNQIKQFRGEVSKLSQDKELEDAFKNLEDNLSGLAADAVAGLFTALAEISSGGKGSEVFGKLTSDVLGGLGDALINFAKNALKTKLLIEGVFANLFGPAGFASIGVALAFGGILKALSKQFAEGFADGGFVSGPGSDKSDSIPARLSNGEFVVQARSVRKYGRGFMEMINNGSMPIRNYQKNFGDLRFADGGLVARQISNAAISGTDLGLNTGGFIAETKISGQDLRLVLKRADSRYSNVT